MVSNLDIWRAANLLIREHGANADREAARLQHLMVDRGDDEGRLVWVRISRAIEASQAAPRNKPHSAHLDRHRSGQRSGSLNLCFWRRIIA